MLEYLPQPMRVYIENIQSKDQEINPESFRRIEDAIIAEYHETGDPPGAGFGSDIIYTSRWKAGIQDVGLWGKDAFQSSPHNEKKPKAASVKVKYTVPTSVPELNSTKYPKLPVPSPDNKQIRTECDIWADRRWKAKKLTKKEKELTKAPASYNSCSDIKPVSTPTLDNKFPVVETQVIVVKDIQGLGEKKLPLGTLRKKLHPNAASIKLDFLNPKPQQVVQAPSESMQPQIQIPSSIPSPPMGKHLTEPVYQQQPIPLQEKHLTEPVYQQQPIPLQEKHLTEPVYQQQPIPLQEKHTAEPVYQQPPIPVGSLDAQGNYYVYDAQGNYCLYDYWRSYPDYNAPTQNYYYGYSGYQPEAYPKTDNQQETVPIGQPQYWYDPATGQYYYQDPNSVVPLQETVSDNRYPWNENQFHSYYDYSMEPDKTGLPQSIGHPPMNHRSDSPRTTHDGQYMESITECPDNLEINGEDRKSYFGNFMGTQEIYGLEYESQEICENSLANLEDGNVGDPGDRGYH
jgi:hypothetical protein